MKLYLVRHGESVANHYARHAGWGQTPLSAQGEKDAVEAGRKIKGLSFDRVYVSDLLRAKQTRMIALPGAEARETPLLREMSVGILSGMTKKDCEESYGEKYTRARTVKDYRPFGGETKEMQRMRLEQFLKQIEEENLSSVIAFTHEGILRRMLEKTGVEKENPTPIPNGSVFLFEKDGGEWRFIKEAL